jgi:hypothetical protein
MVTIEDGLGHRSGHRYTMGTHDPAGHGVQRARAVTTGSKEPQVSQSAQRSHYQATLEEAGRSSSLPTRWRQLDEP